MASSRHLGLGVVESRWFDERHHTVRPLFEFLSYALKDRSDAFTYGGLLSEGYLHGLNHVYEAVEQIRGSAKHRQLDRHDLALVTGQLGYVSGYSSAIVVEGA